MLKNPDYCLIKYNAFKRIYEVFANGLPMVNKNGNTVIKGVATNIICE